MTNSMWIEREEVGLVPPKPGGTPFQGVSSITGHYGGGDSHIRDEAALFAIYRQIQYNDMVNKGYSDIMYSIGLNPFRPKPIMLRGLKNRGAANGTSEANRISPSCLFPVGPNLSGVSHIPNWQENLIESLRVADDIIEFTFGRKLAWVPHSFWRPTACPGSFMKSIINSALDERPLPPPPPAPFVPDADFKKRPLVGFNHMVRDDGPDGYVRWVQNFLNQTSPEGCSVDGIWGWISHDRLVKFQGYFQAQGFPCRPNGVTDIDTWATIHYIATVQRIL